MFLGEFSGQQTSVFQMFSTKGVLEGPGFLNYFHSFSSLRDERCRNPLSLVFYSVSCELFPKLGQRGGGRGMLSESRWMAAPPAGLGTESWLIPGPPPCPRRPEQPLPPPSRKVRHISPQEKGLCFCHQTSDVAPSLLCCVNLAESEGLRRSLLASPRLTQ